MELITKIGVKMTIQEIASRLNNCAEHHCSGCKYKNHIHCINHLIKEMGTEVAKIGEQMRAEENDGK